MSANWVKIKLDKGRVKEVTDTRMDIREVLAVLYSQEDFKGLVNRDQVADRLVQLYKDNS
jgi:argininosuccinate synthase